MSTNTLTLGDAELNLALIEAFEQIEVEKEYNYYNRFKPLLGGKERNCRNYIRVFIGLALHGVGPGKTIQHTAAKLIESPSEILNFVYMFDRILTVLPHPLTHTSTEPWIGKMWLFTPGQQEVRRIILSKIITDEAVVQKVLKRAYPRLLENRDVQSAENLMPLLMANLLD